MPSAAEELRGLLGLAAADPEVRPLAERLLDLVDQALRERERSARHELARRFTNELGQPLSEVMGYAELLAERSYPPAEQTDLLRRIASAAERLGRLMHGLAATVEAPPEPTPTEAPPPPPPPPTAAGSPLDELRQAALEHLPPPS